MDNGLAEESNVYVLIVRVPKTIFLASKALFRFKLKVQRSCVSSDTLCNILRTSFPCRFVSKCVCVLVCFIFLRIRLLVHQLSSASTCVCSVHCGQTLNRSGKRNSRWNLHEKGGGVLKIQTLGCLLGSFIRESTLGFSAGQTIIEFCKSDVFLFWLRIVKMFEGLIVWSLFQHISVYFWGTFSRKYKLCNVGVSFSGADLCHILRNSNHVVGTV